MAAPSRRLLACVALLGAAALAIGFLTAQEAHGRPEGIFDEAESGCVCHTPTESQAASLSFDGYPLEYAPGEEYTLTITISANNLLPVPQNQGGFNIKVSAGNLVLVDATKTKLKAGDDRQATHQAAGNDQRQWTIRWKAPADASAGDVTLWLASNAVNGDGTNGPEDQWRKTAVTVSAPDADTTPPAGIGDLAVGSVTKDSVALEWSVPSGNPASYEVAYSTESLTASNFDAAPKAASPPSPGSAGSDQSFTVAGLTSSTKYYFAVRSSDAAGNDAAISNVVNATTAAGLTPPSPPRNLAAIPDGSRIRLAWLAPLSDGGSSVTGYRVMRGATEVEARTNVVGTVTKQSYDDTNVTEGTTYWYAVAAVNAQGASDQSDRRSAAAGGSAGDVAGDQNPVVSVLSPAPLSRVRGTVLVSGTAEDPEGSLVLVEVAVAGAPFVAASGTEVWSYTFDSSNLTGTRLLTVRAVDAAGNAGSVSILLAFDNPADAPAILPVLPVGAAVAMGLAAALRRRRGPPHNV